MDLPESVDGVADLLAGGNYVADRSLATSLFLALKLGRPLFLEGEAGVGKTEIAKVLSQQLGRRLIRLQCYEGLDVASAVYEWNYARQMIEIRLAEAMGDADRSTLSSDIFRREFLIERPLLQAMESSIDGPPVLLIDELDRTDEPFEAYLLEVLSDFQVTIPELGTIKADKPPIVHRHLQSHPRNSRRAEAALLLPLGRLPGCQARGRDPAPESAWRIGGTDATDRRLHPEGARRWTCSSCPASPKASTGPNALMQLNALVLDPAVVNDTLGVLLKYQDDIQRLQGSEAQRILAEVNANLAEARREGL